VYKRQVFDKVREEVDELKEAQHENNRQAVEEEFGDLLFALVNAARFMELDPEACLQKATNKFSRRFKAVEQRMAADGKPMAESTLEVMDSYWDAVKREE
jgi:uncharacterized protein YabN with tetrapyrrole methylase and pyrophosphatase domain